MSEPGAGDAVADAIAGAVLAVDGVAGLYGGLFGEIGTYLPGRRVPGVRVDATGNAEVHVVLRWGAPVPATADAVRLAVSLLVPGTVHVVVDDVAAAGGVVEPDGRRGGVR